MTLSPLGSTKNRKTRYNEGERKLAQRLGGRRQPGSGSIDGYKGDVVTKKFLIDQKVTEHSSFRLTAGVLNKITFEARQANKHPAIEIEMQVAPSTPKEWILIPLDVFDEYRKLSDGLEEIKDTKADTSSARGAEDRDAAGASDAGARTAEDEIVQAADSQAKKETARDARAGESCYNAGEPRTGIRFRF